jgi:hypothetical protein
VTVSTLGGESAQAFVPAALPPRLAAVRDPFLERLAVGIEPR